MSPATLESPALEFDFDTAELNLLALDSTDDHPSDPAACSNIDQGNELPAPQSPESGPLFTDNQMFTLEDDEAPTATPTALEAEPLSPLQLPASIPAAMEAALEAPAAPAPVRTSAPGLEFPDPALPLCDPLTRRQALSLEIEALESHVVEYSETEYELAEKVSQVRKWRKEALEQLRGLKWQLNAMSDEDAEKPAFEPAAQQSQQLPPGSVTITGRAGGKEIGSVTLTGKAYDTLTAYPPTIASISYPAAPTIDHGGQQSLTALGLTPKQLEKFEIEGIRTVSQFERALADRSIENVRGIQERTLDKIKIALDLFRKQHPIPDPDDRPVLTASERDAKIEAAEEQLGEQATESASVEPEAMEVTPTDTADQLTPKPPATIGSINLVTDPMNASLANVIIQAGRDACIAGFSRVDNPLRTGASVHREDLWNDGWVEASEELMAKSATQADAAGATTEKPEKPARKPRAKKAKAEATKPADPYELYQTVKAKFPEYTLFVRVGDFYELFCEDAEKTAELFGLTLTVGKRGDSPAIPMIGFPAYQLEEYEAKASNAGHKVYIMEPRTDGTQATKPE